MHEPNIPRMRTIRQVAKETHFPETAIRRLVRENAIVYVRYGNKVLINLDRFLEYLDHGGNYEATHEVGEKAKSDHDKGR